MLATIAHSLKQPQSRKKWLLWVLALVLLYFVFLHRIGHPNMTFWDEKHHVTSANRYIEGVMFMEAHPPLGKLMIAAAELIEGSNNNLDRSIFTRQEDGGKRFPDGYNHFPGRVPSSFLGALGAVFLFFTLRNLTGYTSVAAVFTSMYVFDTAMVLQSRSAMLDGPMICFSIMTFWWFSKLLLRTGAIRVRDYALMALFIALAVSTKVNSMVLLILFPVLWGYENREQLLTIIRSPRTEPVTPLLKPLGLRAGVALLVVVGIFTAIMYIHTGLGKNVSEGRYYRASPEYKAILDEKKNTWHPANFWPMYRDQVTHLYRYNMGVPPLKLFNPKENGSYPLKWPFGGKTIRYRWDRKGDHTSFVYFVPNAFGWTVGLVGLFMSSLLIVGHAIGEFTSRNNRLMHLMRLFLFLWVTYMYILVSAPRVMYLYHYLLPLTMSWILAALSFAYIFQSDLRNKNGWLKSAMVLIVLQNIAVFLYFMPFPYHLPLTREELSHRAWSSIWEMRYER